MKKTGQMDIEIEMDDVNSDKKEEPIAEAVLSEGKYFYNGLLHHITQ